MSELNQSSVSLLERAIDDKIRKAVRGGQSTHLATVTRISNDGTTWVRVYGGAEETPVRRMTTDAQVGDVINVTFSGLSCMGVGNVTNPSASVVQVENVEIAARGAAVAAQAAWAQADDAAVAAQTAWSHADEAADAASSANKSATNALGQLGIVQDVVGVLNYVAAHGGFVQTQDAEIVEGKVYFTLDSQTGDYVPVVDPQESALSSYYELSEDYDDVMGDFIMAHLAVTSRGLWMLPSGIGSAADEQHAAGYKVLLSNDGTYIYDGSGALVTTYGESITFDSSRSQYIGNEDAYILFTPETQSDPASIVIGGANVQIGSNAKLSQLLASSIWYDHEFTKANGSYTFTAKLYLGDENVTEQVDPDHFAWTLRTESGDVSLGTGLTKVISESDAGYRASVYGEYIEVIVGSLVDASDNVIVDAAGDSVAIHGKWEAIT